MSFVISEEVREVEDSIEIESHFFLEVTRNNGFTRALPARIDDFGLRSLTISLRALTIC